MIVPEHPRALKGRPIDAARRMEPIIGAPFRGFFLMLTDRHPGRCPGLRLECTFGAAGVHASNPLQEARAILDSGHVQRYTMCRDMDYPGCNDTDRRRPMNRNRKNLLMLIALCVCCSGCQQASQNRYLARRTWRLADNTLVAVEIDRMVNPKDRVDPDTNYGETGFRVISPEGEFEGFYSVRGEGPGGLKTGVHLDSVEVRTNEDMSRIWFIYRPEHRLFATFIRKKGGMWITPTPPALNSSVVLQPEGTEYVTSGVKPASWDPRASRGLDRTPGNGSAGG